MGRARPFDTVTLWAFVGQAPTRRPNRGPERRDAQGKLLYNVHGNYPQRRASESGSTTPQVHSGGLPMSIAIQSMAPPDPEEIEYPASDGQPMGRPGFMSRRSFSCSRRCPTPCPSTDFLAADMFWYWEKGQPKSRVAPDVMVVKGVGRAHRRSFFTWREGGAIPCIVFEMASENTWREDRKEAPALRAAGRAGVHRVRPRRRIPRPRLQGFRLVEGRYEPIVADADERLCSDELNLLFGAEGLTLRLFDRTSGAPLPTRLEARRTGAERRVACRHPRRGGRAAEGVAGTNA